MPTDPTLHHRAHALLQARNRAAPAAQGRPREGEGHQGKDQAAQEQQQEILKPHLPRADNDRLAQQLNRRPVHGSLVLLVEEMNDDRHGHGGCRQPTPQSYGIQEIHGFIMI